MHEVLTAAAAAESVQLSAGVGCAWEEEDVLNSGRVLRSGLAPLMWSREECRAAAATRMGRSGLDDDEKYLRGCVLLMAQCIPWRAI